MKVCKGRKTKPMLSSTSSVYWRRRTPAKPVCALGFIGETSRIENSVKISEVFIYSYNSVMLVASPIHDS